MGFIHVRSISALIRLLTCLVSSGLQGLFTMMKSAGETDVGILNNVGSGAHEGTDTSRHYSQSGCNTWQRPLSGKVLWVLTFVGTTTTALSLSHPVWTHLQCEHTARMNIPPMWTYPFEVTLQTCRKSRAQYGENLLSDSSHVFVFLYEICFSVCDLKKKLLKSTAKRLECCS